MGVTGSQCIRLPSNKDACDHVKSRRSRSGGCLRSGALLGAGGSRL
jgi:hypothetical protein